MGGGIIEAMGDKLKQSQLTVITVSGMEECLEVFNSIKSGDLKGVLIEASACKGSCIGGPVMVKNGENYYTKLRKVKSYIKSRKNYNHPINTEIPNNINFNRKFTEKSINRVYSHRRRNYSYYEKNG